LEEGESLTKYLEGIGGGGVADQVSRGGLEEGGSRCPSISRGGADTSIRSMGIGGGAVADLVSRWEELTPASG